MCREMRLQSVRMLLLAKFCEKVGCGRGEAIHLHLVLCQEGEDMAHLPEEWKLGERGAVQIVKGCVAEVR